MDHGKPRKAFIAHRLDILLVLVLAAAAAFGSYRGATLIDPVIFAREANNVWFESDAPRILANMTDRNSNHYRTKVHPLFSLIGYTPVRVLQKALRLDALMAVRVVIASVAALWIAAFFVVLRHLGCRRLDALLFSVAAMTSAAAVFWFTVPETYSFGSLTMLLALGLAAWAQQRPVADSAYVAVSALTLSATVTNWAAGIAATIVNQPVRRTARITVHALCAVMLLWGVQRALFPTAEFFLDWSEETGYVATAGSGGPLRVAASFFFHTAVMPAIQVVDKLKRADWPVMTIQQSLPGSSTPYGMAAIALWGTLLALGVYGVFNQRQHRGFSLALLLTLGAQLALHVLYGDETFLYAAHFLPLLMALAAMGALTRLRPVVLVLAGLFIATAAVNNAAQFGRARMVLVEHGSPRHLVLAQMRLRPSDPWPRGVGHAVLAEPGSREGDKAYHEPGGNFSPGVGSFGVSVWLVDAEGNPRITSETLDLTKVAQRFLRHDAQSAVPAIQTDTPYYRTVWSSNGTGRWALAFHPKPSVHQPILVIRSVGPAGGPIHRLDWDGKQLMVNGRWRVRTGLVPAPAHLGSEAGTSWLTEQTGVTSWKGSDGWGYARIPLANDRTTSVDIEDAARETTSASLPPPWSSRAPHLELPDGRFADSIDAQVAHLMMSLVGNQTRPGEPTNYPLAWLRDGAYVVVALARAGQLDRARRLSMDFAEQDFFGGFGSEADAPGLAIWALGEVAGLVRDPEYDRTIWPHVQRKADLIVEMLTTDKPVYKPFVGPVTPARVKEPDLTLVADPAADDLVIGKMDHHRPLLFVNAVSHLGLLEAATLAERVDRPAQASEWRARASRLQQAWQQAFRPPHSNNERAYISGLWPTGIAAPMRDKFLEGLEERWRARRDEHGNFRETPAWTYFDVAEAHQWLWLGKQAQAWRTVRWFWDHQAAPGLYTWWEGEGEENSFGLWERVRGWVKPRHVTPHYWTAAEMLLLQLDMLAYTTRASNSPPTLVIGAGIPADWLKQSMSVADLHLREGDAAWRWDGRAMKVTLRSDTKLDVQLGPAFPTGTPLEIQYAR